MTDIRYEPAQPPVSAAAARVLLIGEPSSLRAAVALRLQTAAVPLACLDAPHCLVPALSSVAVGGAAGLSGATIVFVTVPRPPGLATRLRHRFRAPALAEDLEQAVMDARELGATRVVVLSTVFRYDDDRGLSLHSGSPTLAAAETAPAPAAHPGRGRPGRPVLQLPDHATAISDSQQVADSVGTGASLSCAGDPRYGLPAEVLSNLPLRPDSYRTRRRSCPGHPATRSAPPGTALGVLAAVLDRDGQQLSATQTRQQALADADHLALLHAIWTAETAPARQQRYRDLLLGALPPGYRCIEAERTRS
jgi:hypothetical protein